MKYLDLLLVGPGGCGQTYFMEFLIKNKLNMNSKDDEDQLKHLESPSKLPNNLKIKKCIYLYNDSYLSLLSHFRRNFNFIQLEKIGNYYNLKQDDVKDINTYYKKLMESKVDLYGFEKHFNNWYYGKKLFPIYFLNFEDLNNFNTRSNLINFLNTDLNFTDFKYIERSKYENINKYALEFYKKIDKKINIKAKEINKTYIG